MTIDLEGMRARLDAATEGPWLAAAKPSSIAGWPIAAPHAGGRLVCSVTYVHVSPTDPKVSGDDAFNRESAANAAFIAHARTDMEALLDYVERLKTPLMQTVEAVRAYLPPDGIEPHEFISRVIEAIDNPQINPIIKDIENGRS